MTLRRFCHFSIRQYSTEGSIRIGSLDQALSVERVSALQVYGSRSYYVLEYKNYQKGQSSRVVFHMFVHHRRGKLLSCSYYLCSSSCFKALGWRRNEPKERDCASLSVHPTSVRSVVDTACTSARRQRGRALVS